MKPLANRLARISQEVSDASGALEALESERDFFKDACSLLMQHLDMTDASFATKEQVGRLERMLRELDYPPMG